MRRLDDSAAAAWLEASLREKHHVVYAHAGYLCKLYRPDAPEPVLYPADPEKASQNVLLKLAKQKLLFEVVLPQFEWAAAHAANPNWQPIRLTQRAINQLLSTRKRLLGRTQGRGDQITQDVAQKVWADAGARCMFEGCSNDLSTIALYNKTARVGYLAHIVASSPNGPRGQIELSHKLSNQPENVMLLCDAHHRLIDVFAPEQYPVERLQDMRKAHVTHIRRCLDGLAYRPVRVATLFANLANIATSFSEWELNEAVLAVRLSMHPQAVAHYMRRTQRDDRRSVDFWQHYLREHEHDIRQLVCEFRRPDPETALKGEIAVFPLHHVATLCLAGRIIGEAQAVHVFQYHRERKTWVWDSNAEPKDDGFFDVEGLDDDEANEVLLSIELTATLDEAAIPEALRRALAERGIPWIRVYAREPSGNCIQQPRDLEAFMRAARTAVNRIQDVIRAQKVHLIAISPASAVFCFGQMLQPGHHPTYTIYDRADRDRPFVEAFSISGQEVSAGSGPQRFTIPLR